MVKYSSVMWQVEQNLFFFKAVQIVTIKMIIRYFFFTLYTFHKHTLLLIYLCFLGITDFICLCFLGITDFM